MLTRKDVCGRAKAGAEFLDLHDPGWAKRIRRIIRVASTYECPLAQLYGRYQAGIERYKLSNDQMLAFGFRADSRELGQDHVEFDAYYIILNTAWEAEVKQRI